MKSIIGIQDSCYICGKTGPLEEHHVFNGSKRRHSERYGLKVDLCSYCHRGSEGVHGKYGQEKSLKIKREIQQLFEKRYSREKFIQIFHKNYLYNMNP